MQLEKEKLEHDLQHKSQEMANLMINFVRKNEMLTEIKSEIAKVSAMLKGEGSRESKQQLILINSKIDSNIQSDEVLKRIEDQFDLIHNNFMKRLHAKHPVSPTMTLDVRLSENEPFYQRDSTASEYLRPGGRDDPVSSAQEVRSGTGRQFDRLLKQLPLTQIVAPTDSETDYFSESVVVTYQTNVPFII